MLLPLPTKQYKTGRVVVNWSAIGKGMTLQIDSLHEIEIVSNENVMKISKSGNTRKERRLALKLKGYIEGLNVGTESFKKLSFVKRLLKISKTLEIKRFELSTYNSLPEFLDLDKKFNFLTYVLNFDNLFDFLSDEDYIITDEDIKNQKSITDEEIKEEIKKLESIKTNKKFLNSITEKQLDVLKRIGKTPEQYLAEQVNQDIDALLNEKYYNIYKSLFLNCPSLKNLKRNYKELAKKLHTDKGGSQQEFIGMKQAYEEVKELFEL